MQITCPHCGRAGRAPDQAAGKTINCPGCSRSFVAPRPTPEPADSQITGKPLALGLSAEELSAEELSPEEPQQSDVCVVCGSDIRVGLACKHCEKEVCSESCL